MPKAANNRLVLPAVVMALLGLGFTGCSQDDGAGTAATATTKVPASTDTAADADADAAANPVSIDMKDYAYEITGAAKAGTTTVSLKNSGTEMHMAALGLLKEGKTIDDAKAALRSEDGTALDATYSQVGSPSAILSPGQSQLVTADALGAGRYAVICFLPTAGEQSFHFAKGMVGTFEVAAGGLPAMESPADAGYTIVEGRIDGPKTLKAGQNILRVTSSGTGPHDFYVLRKRRPGVTYADVDGFFSDVFEGATPPPKGYADSSPAVIVANTFDLQTGDTVTITTALEPGDYLIGCAREDDPGSDGASVQHTDEIIEVTVT